MKRLNMKNSKYINWVTTLLAFGLIGGCTTLPQENSRSTTGTLPASGGNTDISAVGGELLKTEGIGPLKLALSADETIKILGNPETKSKASVWAADGVEHQDWIYKQKGLTLDMITEGGKQKVGNMTASAPCKFKTKRGVGIGTNAQTVMNAYKAEINPSASDSSQSLIIGTVYEGIIFSIKDGRVSSIFFGASAE